MSEVDRNEWVGHADWWLDEIGDDPIYQTDVLPLFQRLHRGPGRMLDLGCGEGQVMTQIPDSIGCDVSVDLLRRARSRGPVVCCELPGLDWLQTDAVDGAYMVLVLEHLSNLEVFRSVARVVRPGGSLILVMNHPAFTADRAGPIVDPSDGEVLWRWGEYFTASICEMATPDRSVTFHHRPLSQILNAAANAGWFLQELIETGFSEEALAAHSGYVGQEKTPRLLGARWMNTQGGRR
ncbi:MAG: class I SAM-dependent methyltransferase [Acidimicrobiia bacterium]|nr:class I SAM-dependent methyltransferase [Acidimicrobiia bacterium]